MIAALAFIVGVLITMSNLRSIESAQKISSPFVCPSHGDLNKNMLLFLMNVFALVTSPDFTKQHSSIGLTLGGCIANDFLKIILRAFNWRKTSRFHYNVQFQYHNIQTKREHMSFILESSTISISKLRILSRNELNLVKCELVIVKLNLFYLRKLTLIPFPVVEWSTGWHRKL